jgi:hypothetical protein
VAVDEALVVDAVKDLVYRLYAAEGGVVTRRDIAVRGW